MLRCACDARLDVGNYAFASASRCASSRTISASRALAGINCPTAKKASFGMPFLLTSLSVGRALRRTPSTPSAPALPSASSDKISAPRAFEGAWGRGSLGRGALCALHTFAGSSGFASRETFGGAAQGQPWSGSSVLLRAFAGFLWSYPVKILRWLVKSSAFFGGGLAFCLREW